MQRKHPTLNKKAISLLLCIVSAFGLWVYVSYVENPEITRSVKHIPISIEGEAELHRNGLAIKSVSSEELSLTLNTKRSNYRHLSSESIEASVNVGALSSVGDHLLNVSVTFPASASGVTITDKNVSVNIVLEKFVTQDFEIVPRFSSPSSAEYSVYKTVLNNDGNIVHVSGGESLVNRIDKIVTSVIDISDATEDFEKQVTIKALDEDGKTVNNLDFGVDLPLTAEVSVYRTASFPVEIDISYDSPGTEASCETDFVKVTGPADTITAWLNEGKTVKTSPVNEYSYRNLTSASLPLQALPEGFEYVGENTVTVSFTHTAPTE